MKSCIPCRYRVTRLRDRLWIGAWLGPRAYWAVAAVAVAIALAGIVPPLVPAAIAAVSIFAAALVADAATGPHRSRLSLQRLAPQPFSLRRSGTLHYRMRNDSAVRVRAGIVETPVEQLNFDDDEIRLDVPPHSRAEGERRLTPVARGTADLGRLYFWFENPVGLIRRRVRVAAQAQFRVYPDLSAVERYGTLHARNKLLDAGLRRMRLRGAGTEPESVREWSSGDPFRAINWKASARRGKIMVAQYEVERSQNVMIVLDAGRLMMARTADQRKFDYAVTAALSVAAVAALANDKVGVVAFASEILRAYAPRSSGRSAARLGEEIHDIEPRFEESDYDAAFSYVRAHVRKRSLVVFFTDMVDPAAQGAVLAQIGTLARRHVVVCAFMNDEAIDAALEAAPATPQAVFRADVALALRDERRAAAASLSRLGIHVIDVPARSLTTALIDQYLRIKQRGLL